MTRRRSFITFALALGLSSCASAISDGGSTASPTPTTSTEAPPPRALVLYVSAHAAAGEAPGANDIWLYDATEDTTRALTGTGDERSERDPRFRDAGRVTFLTDGPGEASVIIQMDLDTGDTRTLNRRDGVVWSTDWDPSGERLATVENTGSGKQVRLYEGGRGEGSTIFDLPPNVGRGGETADEIAATWSPDGTMLAIVDTAGDRDAPPDSEPPITVITPTGDIVADGIAGTMPRWAPDSATLYFRSMYAADRSRWSALEIETGEARTLEVSAAHQLYPSVSPDGRYLAFSDDAAGGEVTVLELTTGDERVVARDAVGPIWLGPERLAVTSVEECRDRCGEGPQWFVGERARIIDLATGDESHARLHHTGARGMGADVWLG